MSTRAVYTFADEDMYHVYKHHDGYPSGALDHIQAAKSSAWELPRFEADEFAAAFIAANKRGPGDCRLTHGPETHGDLKYRYEITVKEGDLFIKAFTMPDNGLIFAGNELQMREFVHEPRRWEISLTSTIRARASKIAWKDKNDPTRLP